MDGIQPSRLFHSLSSVVRFNCDEKSRVANKILSFEEAIPQKFLIGKPDFQVISETTMLCTLVGPDSFMLSKILNINWEWLRFPPDQWDEHKDFTVARDFRKTTKVTNNIAERGIKLMSNYSQVQLYSLMTYI